jgi:general stress protein YciG
MENKEKSQQTEVSGEITVREAGRRGGCSTRDRYQGTGFYRRIGAKGGRATATRWRHLLSEFGRRGGRPRRPFLGVKTWRKSTRLKKDGKVGPRVLSAANNITPLPLALPKGGGD